MEVIRQFLCVLKKLMKTKLFEKKRLFFQNLPRNKDIGRIFPRIIKCFVQCYKTGPTPKNNLQWSTWILNIYCISYMICFKVLGYRQATIQKTAVVSMKKKWPSFSRITEKGRYQATIFHAAQDLPAIIVQVIASFIQHLGGC